MINPYARLLAQGWQAHLAPRAATAPTVVSLFAGCGGSSLGYSMAGYRERLAVEWDDNAVEVFRRNFPEVPVYHGDIAKLSDGEALQLSGLQPGELDVLDGSPPCQGFSTAGVRVMDDPRNSLFREYVRLLRVWQPKALVMENVSGMVKGKMRLIFVDILRELKACGYDVSARLLNAMYFDVPQRRERLIFIGVRHDLKLKPSHPKAQSQPWAADQAIKGAVIDDCGAPKERYARLMRLVKPDERLCDALKQPSNYSYFRCNVGGPARTLVKSVTWGGTSIWHPTEERNLSIGELQRVSSFPDAFQFTGNYEQAVNRMGNSVPPFFMRAIAAHIRKTILEPHYGATR